ncbi:MAG: hypothetical protein QOE61_411 [Micromonosporaceae bacterium]|jgi:hypothetical protein|nr:hypothetical protein [Micromonosporaceae bacterium]
MLHMRGGSEDVLAVVTQIVASVGGRGRGNWFNAGAPEAAADPLIADSSCLGES